ncbi:quinol dehydrogenase ferredoxin subunit NapH [Roseateles sp.]|uniref:quinol dehydrogenase ferredoxin subunit NapH n=1 Tax=Roseateles sp. TaxID=1971397 RepID=UPI00393FA004
MTSAATPTAALASAMPTKRAARSRWLVARRLSQLTVFALFLLGPWAGVWVVKGNLASSLTLGVLPLTDPFVLAQSVASGHWPERAALIGVGIVLLAYGLVAGRAYCGWVCPVNAATDAALWLRRRFKLSGGRTPPRSLRYWLLGAVLVASALTGQMVWEAVNPVTLTQRALIFGGGLAWAALGAVFLFDLFVAPRGWCGHVCPMGAAYALIGSTPLLRVAATHSSRCDDCGDCYAVCPEPQVLVAPIKAKGGAGPVITARECTACARCVDVCPTDVLRFTHRFDTQRD